MIYNNKINKVNKNKVYNNKINNQIKIKMIK